MTKVENIWSHRDDDYRSHGDCRACGNGELRLRAASGWLNEPCRQRICDGMPVGERRDTEIDVPHGGDLCSLSHETR